MSLIEFTFLEIYTQFQMREMIEFSKCLSTILTVFDFADVIINFIYYILHLRFKFIIWINQLGNFSYFQNIDIFM